MLLRVKPTPTRFPTNSFYTPMDNTPLHFLSSVCHPWGILQLFGLQNLELRNQILRRVIENGSLLLESLF